MEKFHNSIIIFIMLHKNENDDFIIMNIWKIWKLGSIFFLVDQFLTYG